MQCQDEALVRDIAAQPDEMPHRAVDEDRQRRPMLVVRCEQVVQAGGTSSGEKIPLVQPEPLIVSANQIEGEVVWLIPRAARGPRTGCHSRRTCGMRFRDPAVSACACLRMIARSW